MFNYCIYAILSIIYSWMCYKLTNKNKYGITFYFVSVMLICIYYIIKFILNFYIELKFKKYLNSLKCKLRQCNYIIKQNQKCNKNECNTDNISSDCKTYCSDNYQNELCKNIIHCDNHYLCKPNKNDCIIKNNDCKSLIDKEMEDIKNKKESQLKDILKTLDEIGIRKSNLEDYLGINIFILTFLFMIFLIYLYYFNKIEFVINLIFLNKLKINK